MATVELTSRQVARIASLADGCTVVGARDGCPLVRLVDGDVVLLESDGRLALAWRELRAVTSYLDVNGD
jgi:hypothetical protein